jgi:hypothetical protein
MKRNYNSNRRRKMKRKRDELENQETAPLLLFCEILVDDLVPGSLVGETTAGLVEEEAIFTFCGVSGIS